MTTSRPYNPAIAHRFRGYLPVIIDVETGGFNPHTDALLEIAAVIPRMDELGRLYPNETHHHHVHPFEGANLDPNALEFNGIDPYHPFRFAISEKEALQGIFKAVRQAMKESACTRAIVVAHNAFFDQGFLNAAIERTALKRSPFHPFSSFDTATLAGLVYGQTVLARAVQTAGLPWREDEAHSALYDAEVTAGLFCRMVNAWLELQLALKAHNLPLPESAAGIFGPATTQCEPPSERA